MGKKIHSKEAERVCTVADSDNKSGDREENQLRVDILTRCEKYQIMCEVFFEFVPPELRFTAMAHAKERIVYEVENSDTIL